MVDEVGYKTALHYLYCRVKNAHGRGKLVPIEHPGEVEILVSHHKNEKKIELYVYREKPSVDTATSWYQLDDESGSTRKKRMYSGYPFIPNLKRTTFNTYFDTFFCGHILTHVL